MRPPQALTECICLQHYSTRLGELGYHVLSLDLKPGSRVEAQRLADLLHARPLARWCDPRWAGLLAGAELVTTKNDHMFMLPRAAAAALAEGIRAAMTSVAVGGVSKPMCAFLDGRLRFSATEQLAPMLARALRLRARFGGARPCLRSAAPDQVAGLVRSFAPNDRTCPERGVGLRNLRPSRLQTPCRRQDREDDEEEEPLDCVPAECL